VASESRRTSLLPVDVHFDVRLLERPPFEVFPVATTLDLALCTLLASGFFFATLQSFGLARYAACRIARSVHVRLARLCIYVKDETLLKRPRRDAEEYTVATLGLFRLGRPISSGSSRLLAYGSLLGCGRGLPAGALSHRRLIVSRSGWAGTGSQEDGGRGNVNVLRHQSVPSARGGVAQSHGGCQCMAGLRCSFGVRNETRRGYSRVQKYKVPRLLSSPPALSSQHAALCSYPCYYRLTPPGQISRALVGMQADGARHGQWLVCRQALWAADMHI